MASPHNSDLYIPVRDWSSVNQGFYSQYRRWLNKSGYSASTLNTYSCAMRLAMSQLDKPYWQINDEDLDEIRALIADRFPSQSTQSDYNKGLRKLAEFLRHRQGKPQPEKQTNWDYFLSGLPNWLAEDVRAYVHYRRRSWLLETQYERTGNLLSPLTRFLRWAAERNDLGQLADLTPPLWFAYLDSRLAAGIKATTVNGELAVLQPFLTFMAESGRSICERFLQIERLPTESRLPRDVPIDQLRQLAAEIEQDATSQHTGLRRTGNMDRAWFRLMLYSGLRVGEVRRLRQTDVDLVGLRLRIEQSKGLKDRVVFLTQDTAVALTAYLPLRGDATTDHLFVYRHLPLSVTYCAQRMRTWGQRCGCVATPHQLRHSCATLLLNAGAPILTVQALLGHKQIDTTLAYARLYDGTVAADYYRAMGTVEQRLQLADTPTPPPMPPAQLVALVDALGIGTLNDDQRELAHTLRQGILALGEQMDGMNPS